MRERRGEREGTKRSDRIVMEGREGRERGKGEREDRMEIEGEGRERDCKKCERERET